MVDVKQVADAADMIVNGYAFTRCAEGFRVLNLNRPDRAVVFSSDGKVLETSMDDIEVRIYIPMDLNRDAILRRLDRVIYQYGEANENNEMEFSTDVGMILSQLEIYDRIWFVRHMPEEGEHSREGIELVKKIMERLEGIPDGCAECFPFEMIDELKRENLGKV